MKGFRSIFFKNFMTVAIALILSFILLLSTFASISYGYMVREKTGTMREFASASVGINPRTPVESSRTA